MSSTAQELESKIRALAAPSAMAAVWQPQLFRFDQIGDRDALAALIDSGEVTAAHDLLEAQVIELMSVRSPPLASRKEALAEMVRQHLAGRPIHEYGVWVFYPWSGALVHVLPESEFCELRSSRNHYKITREEQAVLATKRIGIVGLSVGQATAVTLAQEGVGRSFRLADFDLLSLSNMNRLRTSVASLGLSKVVITAREMYGIDPYLTIEVFFDGLNERNIEAFIGGSGPTPEPVDLLVEECDDLFAKVFLRERAKEHRIPLIMETNERGMLDVERFDLYPDLPLMHGLLRGVRAVDVKSLRTRDKVPYMLAMFGSSKFSPRFVPSLMEIDETIASWPQLASGVALGAALATDSARRIFLGRFKESGRYFVDLDELVSDGKCIPQDAPPALDPPITEMALKGPSLALPTALQEITRDDIVRLVQFATLAPSGGNVQPWRFVARGHEVRCFVDSALKETLLDFERTGTYVALGAAVENMTLAAGAAGLECDVRPFPMPSDANLVCQVSFAVATTPVEVSPLARHMTARATNRRLGERRPILAEQSRALHAAAESANGRLQLLTSPDQLEAIGRVLGGGDRVRFLSERLHRELMSEVRWTPEEVGRRDGIDIATFDLSRTDYAGMRVSRDYDNLRFLLNIGGGGALGRSARDAIASSSAVGLLTLKGTDAETYFHGGRAFERIWLAATSLGLAFQPWASILFLWSRLERGQGVGLEANQLADLRKLRDEFRAIFQVSPDDESEIMLFRVTHAGPPTARSLRFPIEDVLAFDGD